MKTKFIFLTVFVGAFCVLQAQGPQIPNGSFAGFDTIILIPADTLITPADTVSGVITPADTTITPAVFFLTPTDWATIDGTIEQEIGFAIVDTADVAPGSVASLELVTDTLTGESFQEGVIVSFASLGTAQYTGFGFTYTGAPFLFTPDTLLFSYQYTDTTTGTADTAGVVVTLWNSDTTVSLQGNLLMSSSWANVYILMDSIYNTSFVPDSILLQFYSSVAQNPIVGSTLHLDNVRFGYSTVPVETVVSVGPDTFCLGDSVILSAPTNGAYIYYQWYLNNEATPIPNANTSYYTAYNTGSYFVIIDSTGAPAMSAPVSVVIDSPPNVSLIAILGSDTNSFCFPSNPVTLIGTPGGGYFIATGITDTGTFVPYETGTFVLNYVYTDSNSCSAVANDSVSVSICVGIAEVKSDIDLEVYPNPASNVLNIISDKDLAGFNMQIYDVVGRKVASQELDGFTNAINVSALTNGMYITRITDKSNVAVTQSKFDVLR